MWKIKYSLIKEFLEMKLTHSEVLVLLCIARWQNESGWIGGVRKDEVCSITGISSQSFYNAVAGLEQKGILRKEKRNRNDIDLKILNNDFQNKNFSEGYLSLAHAIFKNSEFLKMKSREILLLLDILKNCIAGKKAFLIGSRIFFEKYRKLLGVNERTIKGYLKAIKKFFSVKLHQEIYSFLPIPSKIYGEKTKTISPGEARAYRKHVVSSICIRTKIGTYKSKDLEDIMGLLSQYREHASEEKLEEALANAVEKSLEIINKTYKRKSQWKYKLNSKLIHKLLREELKVQTC